MSKPKTADNGTQPKTVDASQELLTWLQDNDAQPVIRLISPSGAVMPLSDLFQLPAGWRLRVGAVRRDGDSNTD